MIYLIEYDRRSSTLLRMDSFPQAERQRAEEARLELELQLLSRGLEHEVVLLEAESESAVRKTHRRYFEGLRQLLDAALPAGT